MGTEIPFWFQEISFCQYACLTYTKSFFFQIGDILTLHFIYTKTTILRKLNVLIFLVWVRIQIQVWNEFFSSVKGNKDSLPKCWCLSFGLFHLCLFSFSSTCEQLYFSTWYCKFIQVHTSWYWRLNPTKFISKS